MESRIKEVMSAVFEINLEDINDNTSPDTIDIWDSLRHMNLVAALEEEFSIEFNDDEIVEMMNFALVKTILSEKVET
tara:strand:- start:6 stop:236 length:231 start_codon:yes stop_codon:yes gene_type:complete